MIDNLTSEKREHWAHWTSTILQCTDSEALDMSDNHLEGSILPDLGCLQSLQYLDLFKVSAGVESRSNKESTYNMSHDFLLRKHHCTFPFWELCYHKGQNTFHTVKAPCHCKYCRDRKWYHRSAHTRKA